MIMHNVKLTMNLPLALEKYFIHMFNEFLPPHYYIYLFNWKATNWQQICVKYLNSERLLGRSGNGTDLLVGEMHDGLHQ